MYEFQSFVYLDLQKTGTKFIVNFLDRFSVEEGRRRKHEPIRKAEESQKLHFISVRDPLDQYISLYSFGCGGKGTLFNNLRRQGYASLYSRRAPAFQDWLNFVLTPTNAPFLDSGYGSAGSGAIATLLGFQSYRFLHLAFRNPKRVLDRCASKDDILAAYATQNIISVIIHHHTFIADLKKLVQNELCNLISDVPAALRYLDETPPLNKSKRVDREQALELDDATSNLLSQREWFYYEKLQN